jgi:hypothetical protein
MITGEWDLGWRHQLVLLHIFDDTTHYKCSKTNNMWGGDFMYLGTSEPAKWRIVICSYLSWELCQTEFTPQ